MGDFKISGKNVITQSGTAEPVLASNVTLGTGIVKAANIIDAATTTLSCTTDSTITVATADSSSLSVGMAVSGTNIPANAHIITIPNATSFTITSAATGGATSTLTFRTGITSAKIEDDAVTSAKVSGLVKGDVGLGNVDNTTDALKPVSTAASTALALKAPLASPTFTGTTVAPVIKLTPTATASAPSGTEGALYYDSTKSALMSYGTSWQMVSKASGAGGTEATSGGYKYHTFLTGANFVISGGSLAVDLFMIGGGGGGGAARYGGGGGAGGLIWIKDMTLTSQTCVIVIGGGGNGDNGSGGGKTNGVDTTMTRSTGNLTAKGGGWGATGDNTSTTYGLGNVGGCGGGGMNYNSGSDNFGTSNQSSQAGDSGTYGIGFSGGRGYSSPNYDGGGGGGLSEVGVSATNTSGGTSGRGGHGVHTLSGLSQAETTTFLAGGAASQSEVVSSVRYIGAGGGGGGHNPVSAIGSGNRVPGGSGFGADGGVQGSKSAGLAAPANSGSGGGAATVDTSANSQAGGAGGSGIVIIRYPL